MLTAAERVREAGWACADSSPQPASLEDAGSGELCFARSQGNQVGLSWGRQSPQLLKWWSSEKPLDPPGGEETSPSPVLPPSMHLCPPGSPTFSLSSPRPAPAQGQTLLLLVGPDLGTDTG